MAVESVAGRLRPRSPTVRRQFAMAWIAGVALVDVNPLRNDQRELTAGKGVRQAAEVETVVLVTQPQS